MNSYIAGDIAHGVAAFDREESRHAVTVMRLKQGEEILVTDCKGRLFKAVARDCRADKVTADIIEELPSNESPAAITVLIGSLKSDKFEYVAQKLTEIGVSRIISVKMARCVALPEADKKSQRLEKIAREAVKQCKRSVLPQIKGPVSWSEALSMLSASEVSLMPWEEARTLRVKDVYAENPGGRNIALLIGPEGGITPEEADRAQSAGAHAVTLGPRILRAETAAILCASLAQSLWGDV